MEFGIYKAITTVSGFRKNQPHVSFKGIELQVYPSAITKHPDLFCEEQTLKVMFLYNSFKTFNENSKSATANYNNLVNLLWEDIIKFFNIAADDIIPASLRKYKRDIVNLTIADSPPQLPGLFELQFKHNPAAPRDGTKRRAAPEQPVIQTNHYEAN